MSDAALLEGYLLLFRSTQSESYKERELEKLEKANPKVASQLRKALKI